MKLLRKTIAPLLLFVVGIAVGAILYAFAPELYRTSDDEPPANLVIVTGEIHTSGQPSVAQLGGLKEKGYDLVINLAPPQVFGSLPGEGGLVAQTGVRYVNIPVDWHQPSPKDFEFFSGLLNQSSGQQVLVHCQVNKRASLFTFLYRVIHQHAEPDEAYEKVIEIWVPDPHWLEFANDVLARNGLRFEP